MTISCAPAPTNDPASALKVRLGELARLNAAASCIERRIADGVLEAGRLGADAGQIAAALGMPLPAPREKASTNWMFERTTRTHFGAAEPRGQS